MSKYGKVKGREREGLYGTPIVPNTQSHLASGLSWGKGGRYRRGSVQFVGIGLSNVGTRSSPCGFAKKFCGRLSRGIHDRARGERAKAYVRKVLPFNCLYSK